MCQALFQTLETNNPGKDFGDQARAQYKWHLLVNMELIMIRGHMNKNNLSSGSERSMDTNKTLNMLIAWWNSQHSG